MWTLLGENVMSDTIIKRLWTYILHTHATQILASLPDELQLDRLLEIDNKIYANNTQEKNVYATFTIMDNQDRLSQLKNNITELSIQIQSIMKNQQ